MLRGELATALRLRRGDGGFVVTFGLDCFRLESSSASCIPINDRSEVLSVYGSLLAIFL